LLVLNHHGTAFSGNLLIRLCLVIGDLNQLEVFVIAGCSGPTTTATIVLEYSGWLSLVGGVGGLTDFNHYFGGRLQKLLLLFSFS
jgi:hypothetical protein